MTFGTQLEESESVARAEYESAFVRLLDYDEQFRKKEAFLKQCVVLGVKPDSVSGKKIKLHEEFNFDSKKLRVARETLEKNYIKARSDYALFDPKIVNFDLKNKRERSVTSIKFPDADTKVLLDAKDIEPLKEYTWNDERWAEQILKISFGSRAEDCNDDGALVSVGPGEERIACIIGGKIQGGNVSYDIVTRDGQKFEVKSPDHNNLIRISHAHGAKTLKTFQSRITEVLDQVEIFLNVLSSMNLKLDDDEQNAIAYVKEFCDNEYDNIVAKGEISYERIKNFRAMLSVLTKIRESWKTKEDSKQTISLNEKEYKVDKDTFIDVFKKVTDITNFSTSEHIDDKEIAASELKNIAFIDPKTFINEIYSSIDVNVALAGTDGCFLAYPHGFKFISKSLYSQVFKLGKLSMGKPYFSFIS